MTNIYIQPFIYFFDHRCFKYEIQIQLCAKCRLATHSSADHVPQIFTVKVKEGGHLAACSYFREQVVTFASTEA